MTDKMIAYLKKAEIELKSQHEANLIRHSYVHRMTTCHRLAIPECNVPEISDEEFYGPKKTKRRNQTSKSKPVEKNEVLVQNKVTTDFENQSNNHNLGQNSEAQEQYIVDGQEYPNDRDLTTKTLKSRPPKNTRVLFQNKVATISKIQSSNHTNGPNSEAQEKYIVDEQEDPNHSNPMNMLNYELSMISHYSDSFDRSLDKCNSLEMLSKIEDNEDLHNKKIIQDKVATVFETRRTNRTNGPNSEAQEQYIVDEQEDPNHRNLMNSNSYELSMISQYSDSFDRSLEKCNSLEMQSKIEDDEDLHTKKIAGNRSIK